MKGAFIGRPICKALLGASGINGEWLRRTVLGLLSDALMCRNGSSFVAQVDRGLGSFPPCCLGIRSRLFYHPAFRERDELCRSACCQDLKKSKGGKTASLGDRTMRELSLEDQGSLMGCPVA